MDRSGLLDCRTLYRDLEVSVNQQDHFDLDAADTVRELKFQRQALHAVAARALLHDVPGDPDRLDECDCLACSEWLYDEQ